MNVAHNGGCPGGRSVWCVTDERPGHESQIRGLVKALTRIAAVTAQFLPAPSAWTAIGAWLRRRPWMRVDGPAPSLLIGAGHRTHLALLALARASGAPTVLLMKPSFPPRWFDLCVVPEHDGVAPGPKVLLTRGVLNPMLPAAAKASGEGLILIGGPSKHYGWDELALLEQVQRIANDARPVHWTLTTSPRTPSSTEAALLANASETLRVVPFAETDKGWLPSRLAAAEQVWVSEDSASMVYESLTAHAATGLIEVPRYGQSRVSQGVDGLVRDGSVTTYSAWVEGHALPPPDPTFNESDRCARWIAERWLQDR